MGISDKLLAKTANIGIRKLTLNMSEKDAAPKTSPGRLLDIQGKITAAENFATELQEKIGKALELPLSNICEIPGRRRKLNNEQFEELKNNLSHHPLVTPISVIKRSGGKFELISGHNRFHVYRELGKKTIPAIIIELDSETVDIAAFYANLLSPSLPDFEKYLGFKKRQKQTHFDQAKLAKEAGISSSQMSRLFSYDRLPSKAIVLLKQHSDLNLLGNKTADELARIAKDKEELVIEAIQKLIDNPDFTQKKAVAFVKQTLEKPKNPVPKEQIIRVGKSKFCSIKTKNATLSVHFKDPEIAYEWEIRILKFIQEVLKV
jgi:ParB family transcriptional regulator, chromosome partitioning protein